MPLESATYITDLVSSNPASSDGLNQADDHMRLLKSTLKATFPNFTSAPLNSTQAQIDAITAFLVSGVLRGNGTVPAGMIDDFGGTTPPVGWLTCDGQAVSRTTFSVLFTAIGTTWGAGDGSTTFNVPNLVSRYRRHRDNGVLAGAVGALQSPANLAHIHNVAGNTGTESVAHSHTQQGTFATAGMNSNQSHTHTYDNRSGGDLDAGGGPPGGDANPGGATTGSTNIDHTHNVTISGQTSTESAGHSHTFAVTSAGGSADDPNEARPYSATVLTCIKA